MSLDQESKRLQSEGLVIRERDITNIQVRIPQCCRDGGVIIENGREIGPCPHVVQKLRTKRGNVGL